MVVGEVLSVIAVAAWLYFLWSRRRFYVCALKMKGPWGLPFIGVVYKINKLEDILYLLPQYTKEYNQKSYFSWLGTYPIVYTIDPEVAEIVLQSPDCINKTTIYSAIDDAGGNGLISSKPPRWTKHRKLLNPCFGYKVLLGMMPTFNKYARDVCGEMDNLVGCGQVDISQVALKTGLKSSISTVIGSNVQSDSGARVLKSFEGVFGFIIDRILRPWLKSMAVYSLTNDYKLFMEDRDCIRYFMEDLIESKVKAADINKNPEKVSYLFIDQVIKIYQENDFSMNDVVFETSLMVIAGYETTGRTLFYTLLFLAMNPQFQDSAFDEVSTFFSGKATEVSNDDFKSLVYLEMCINETLRLTPSIPLIGRECDDDVRISEEITLPRGTDVYIDIFNIHRDEDIWGPKAKQFHPDHFLPSNLMDKHKCAFLPFSRGKRNCIGWQYSMMFLRVMLAHILRRYWFSTTFRFEDLRFKECVSLKCVEVPLLEVHRR